MDNNSSINRGTSEYYNKLLNSNDHKVIFDALADKILATMDVEVLDFSQNPIQRVSINQIRYENNILKLKKPLPLIIRKKLGYFTIYQEDFFIFSKADTFKRALSRFQEDFFTKYKIYNNMDSNDNNIINIKNLLMDFIKNEE